MFSDGHHKLVRWKLVTHGGIDGYSRLIVYLKCSTNNRASTVYELFLAAIQQYHLPCRVHSDQGCKNIRVAQRGAERNSIITGSPCNQKSDVEHLSDSVECGGGGGSECCSSQTCFFTGDREVGDSSVFETMMFH